MKKIIKHIIFFVLLLIAVWSAGELVRPKRFPEIAINHTKDEHAGLFELNRNSLDVLYLGSSHAFSSVSPEDIFHEYGITGYVQATSCQRIWQSYFYLKETLYTQHPQVVILDVFTLFDDLAQSEAFNREAIDRMKLSGAKIEAVQLACALNPKEENFLSYFFPIIRYHDRWEELEYTDYEYFFDTPSSLTKGFLPRIGSVEARFNGEEYTEENSVVGTIPERCLKYLNLIKQKCDEEDITLVLVKYPTCLWNGSKSVTTQEWAQQNNVEFLDFNTNEELIEKAKIDWCTDSLDGGNHLNYDGAMKLTPIIGKYLQDNFDIIDKRKYSEYNNWISDYRQYKRCVKNYLFAQNVDVKRWFQLIKEDNYSVVFSASGIDISLYKDLGDEMNDFGFDQELIETIENNNNLLFYNDQQVALRRISAEPIVENHIFSQEFYNSIKLGNEKKQGGLVYYSNSEHISLNGPGILFLVWDPEMNEIVDKGQIMYDTSLNSSYLQRTP